MLLVFSSLLSSVCCLWRVVMYVACCLSLFAACLLLVGTMAIVDASCPTGPGRVKTPRIAGTFGGAPPRRAGTFSGARAPH